MKTFEITCSYLAPQSYRGWVEAETPEEAEKELRAVAKKQGFVAFKADKIEEADLSPLSDEYTLPDASPSSSKLN